MTSTSREDTLSSYRSAPAALRVTSRPCTRRSGRRAALRDHRKKEAVSDEFDRIIAHLQYPRLSVLMHESTADVVRTLRHRYGWTPTKAVGQAFGTLKFMMETVARGERIAVISKHGRVTREVVFEWQDDVSAKEGRRS